MIMQIIQRLSGLSITHKPRSQQAGFSLVELSVVLVIVGLLTTGGFQAMKVQRESAKYTSSTQTLAQVKQALLSFALVNHYLPCPDTDATPDGKENRTGIACTAAVGTVPYADLGLNRNNVVDGWGYSIRYAVNQETTSAATICAQSTTPPAGRSANYFCNTPTAPKTALPQFDLNTLPTQTTVSTGDYWLCSASAASCTAASNMSAQYQSVVLVAYNKDGGVTNCGSLGTQENENCDTDNLYWQRLFTDANGVFFDDTVATLSGYDIKAAFLKYDSVALTP